MKGNIKDIIQNGDLTEFEILFAGLDEDERIQKYHLTIALGKLELVKACITYFTTT
jgi:hypothetical protein